jgi:uncharacterized membrane protein
MTSTQVRVLAQPVERANVVPCLRDVVARVAVSVATAVVAPTALFATTLVLFDLTTAVLVALAWMAGAMCCRWTSGRPVSGLLVLALGIMTVKTAITLATGNTFIYFIQPVFVDLAVSGLFLGSLWSGRPIVARLAPDFFPMDATVEANAAIRTLFRRLTLLWGLVILTKGIVTFWLLTSLSTVHFVLIKGGVIISLTSTAAVVTVVWSAIVARREGFLEPSAPSDVAPADGFRVPA